MRTPHRRRIPILLAVLVLVAVTAAAVYFVLPRARSNDGQIEGSGTIEATQVDVAPQVAGRVIALRVREGEQVKAGQVVVELDHETSDAQVAQAQAAVAAAEARLAQAQVALTIQQAQAAAAVDQARAAVDASRTRVPQADESVELQAATVAAQVEQARAQVRAATASLAATEASLRAAEATLRVAEANLVNTQADVVRLESLYRDGAVAAQQRDAGRTALASAAAQRDGARAQRDAARAQRQVAGAALNQAKAALNAALANRRTVPIRRHDADASRAQVEQAQAALRSAQSAAGLVIQRAREVDAARAAVEQAGAALRLAGTVRGHAVVRAPIAGVVVSRSIEVGDLVTVGTPMLTVADLTRVYLRIFVAETDLGLVKLGQPVEVRIDAFPRRVFQGSVQQISSRAEFTPGNVQTREERANLVFAVRVALPNPEGILKPGLPADAIILTETSVQR
ncbi:MAG: HlyD family secretion protein [Armatimonadota bacterium]